MRTKQEQLAASWRPRAIAVVGRRGGVPEKTMISVVIPALNAEATLPATLTALVPAALEGLVREVIVVDGGSKRPHARDRRPGRRRGARPPRPIAAPRCAPAPTPRGIPGCCSSTPTPCSTPVGSARPITSWSASIPAPRRHAAAAFRFALDDDGIAPRALEGLVRLRCAMLRLPYGEQGLLIPRPPTTRRVGTAPCR